MLPTSAIQPAEKQREFPAARGRGTGASTPPAAKDRNAPAQPAPKGGRIERLREQRSVGRIVRSRPCAHSAVRLDAGPSPGRADRRIPVATLARSGGARGGASGRLADRLLVDQRAGRLAAVQVV